MPTFELALQYTGTSTQQSIEMNTTVFNLDCLPMLTDAAALIDRG
jgi:hypothetical protein